jgi:hypothetical protein
MIRWTEPHARVGPNNSWATMRALSALLIVLGLASSMVLSTHLGRLYEQTRPAFPDQKTGRIYEIHPVRGGRTVYVSQSEFWFQFGSYAGGSLIAVAGAVLFALATRKRQGP